MPAQSAAAGAGDIAPFAAAYAPPDEALATVLLAQAGRSEAAEAAIDIRATRLIEAIRARIGGVGGVEDFLHAYALSTKEGLALMVLAEALLRVPDAVTADRLIEDKLGSGDWSHHDARSNAFLVSASAWTLGITARVIHPSETPEGIVETLVKRLGMPAVRAATRQAMRLIGSHFVMGETIEKALARARSHREVLYSFDMLGEGARNEADAEHYFEAYAQAIAAIGAQAGGDALPKRPGISVKLSALHPRYEPLSRERVLKELGPRLLELARLAKSHALLLTVDAEEADRLELSLDVIAEVLRDPSLAGWDGFGLAVQAYQKRAGAVIDWIAQAAEALDRRLTVRLVKGAYWDTEIKRAQERGLADYPVFTRKAMTDLSYADCLRRLLRARPRLYPQFATHNALTVASAIEEAGGVGGYEFQRLYGMGDALYEELLRELPALTVRVYAPVGGSSDLLAYLVRRLLENGANSSFVSVVADRNVPIATILRRPQSWIGDAAHARHSHIPLPRDLFEPQRRNSMGVEFGERAALDALLDQIRAAPHSVAGRAADRRRRGRWAQPRCTLADRWQRDRHGRGRRRGHHRVRDGGRSGRLFDVERHAGDRACGCARPRRRPDRREPSPPDRALATRRRQDARRLRFGSARGRRLSAATTPAKRAARSPLRRCRGRPARATNCAIAGAASSSASVRGISRWRSSPARLPARSLRAMRWWPSPPSRPRSSPLRP